MAFPEFDVAGLAKFTGRPEASFSDYADEALEQALLFFKRATCLTDMPENEDDALVASKAIYQLADYFVLAQPYQEKLAAPFSSESIGSYSYSKMVNSIVRREKTNLLWFDLAVEELGQCNLNNMVGQTMGGIGAFERDGTVVPQGDGTGYLLGPADVGRGGVFTHDPSVLGDGFTGVYGGGLP